MFFPCWDSLNIDSFAYVISMQYTFLMLDE